MFQEWGFLIGEIWVLLVLAAVLGLAVGVLYWGNSYDDPSTLDSLRDQLERERLRVEDYQQKIAELEGAAGYDQIISQLNECSEARVAAEAHVILLEQKLESMSPDFALQEALAEAQARTAVLEAELATCEAEKVVILAEADAAFEPLKLGQRPTGLSAPRNGQADDLKVIKGVGPKLEKMCNDLGFWHFDQIAAWSADEVAWVDDNLVGFKGRVSRDQWVAQAKDLAQSS